MADTFELGVYNAVGGALITRLPMVINNGSAVVELPGGRPGVWPDSVRCDIILTSVSPEVRLFSVFDQDVNNRAFELFAVDDLPPDYVIAPVEPVEPQTEPTINVSGDWTLVTSDGAATELLSPANGDVVIGNTLVLEFTDGGRADRRVDIWLGTAPGGRDIHDSDGLEFPGASPYTINSVPTGSVYLTLNWSDDDYATTESLTATFMIEAEAAAPPPLVSGGWPTVPAAQTTGQGGGLISGAYFGGGVLTSNGGTANDHAFGQIALMTGELIGFSFHNRVDSATGGGIADPWVYALTQSHGNYAAGNGGTYQPELWSFDSGKPFGLGSLIFQSAWQYSPCDLGDNSMPIVRLSEPVPMSAGDKFWIREKNLTPVPNADYGYASVARANEIGRTAGWRSRNGRRMHTTHADDTARFGALGGNHMGRFLYRDSPLDGFGTAWQEWTRDRPIVALLMRRDGVEYFVGDIYFSYDPDGYDDPQWVRTVRGGTFLRQRFTEVNATASYRSISLYHGHDTSLSFSNSALAVRVIDLATDTTLATGVVQPSAACYNIGASGRRHAVATMDRAWTQVQGRTYAYQLSTVSNGNWLFNSYTQGYYQATTASAPSVDARDEGYHPARETCTQGVAEVSVNDGGTWTTWGAYRQYTRDLGIYAIRDGVSFDAAGAIAGGSVTTAIEEPPSLPVRYGPDFANFLTGAYRCGWADRRVGIRFTAERDGSIDGIMLHWRFGGASTGIGDGGEIRVRIVNDDAGMPGNTTFSETTFLPALDGSGNSGFFGSQPALNNVLEETLALTPIAPLSEGSIYHVFLENIAADPENNYIGVNGMAGRLSGEPTEGWAGAQYGSADEYRLTLYDSALEPGSSENKAVVQLNYDTGYAQGYPVNAGSFDADNYIEGARRTRQPFRLPTAIRLAAARLNVGRVSGTGPLTATITDTSNNTIATSSVAAANIPLQQERLGHPCGDHGWITFTGMQGVDLQANTTFYFNLTCPSGTRYFAYAGEVDPAWDVQVRGFDGRTAQYNDGTGWAGWIDGASRNNSQILFLHFDASEEPPNLPPPPDPQPDFPEFVIPAEGIVLPPGDFTASWEPYGSAVTNWWIYVGNVDGGSQYFDSGDIGAATSVVIPGLPQDSSTLYFTLWYKVGGTWKRDPPSRVVTAYTPNSVIGTPSTASRSPDYLDDMVTLLPSIDTHLNAMGLTDFACRPAGSAIVGVDGHNAMDAAYRTFGKLNGLRNALAYAHAAGETAAATAIATVIKDCIDLYIDNLLAGHDPNSCITGTGFSTGISGTYWPNLANVRGQGAACAAMAAMHRAGIETAWCETKLAACKAFLDIHNQAPASIASYGTRWPHDGGGWHITAAVGQAVHAIADVLGDQTYRDETTLFVAQMRLYLGTTGSLSFRTDTGHGDYVLGALVPMLEAQLRGAAWWPTRWTAAEIATFGTWFAANQNDGGGYTGADIGQYAAFMSVAPAIAALVPTDGSTYNDYASVNSVDVETLGSAVLGGAFNLAELG